LGDFDGVKRAKSANESEVEAVSSRLCGRVRELRRKSRWTLEQLSKACGVSRSMLSQIERDKRQPDARRRAQNRTGIRAFARAICSTCRAKRRRSK